MTPPPFLIGTTLLFWGWQTGFFAIGSSMAIILESHRLVSWRWQPQPASFNRVGDFTTLLLVFVVISALLSQQPTQTVFIILQVIPMVVFPLVAALTFSTYEKIPATAMFVTLRKAKPATGLQAPPSFSLDYPFFGLCLLAAGITPAHNQIYYPVVVILIGWALWSFRCRHTLPVVWFLILSLLILFGYVGQHGLQRLHTNVTTHIQDWLSFDFNPFKQRTAIGDIGQLKLSDRILFRVKRDNFQHASLLLREGSFNVYHAGSWNAFATPFHAVPGDSQDFSWQLQPHTKSGTQNNMQSITIFKSFDRGAGILPLPMGSTTIHGLPAESVEINTLGTVKFKNAPKDIAFQVNFDATRAFGGPPTKSDHHIPRQEKPALSQIALDLNLAALAPTAALQTIQQFFLEQFRYSLYLDVPKKAATPLSDFLLHTHTGHCEYFATATVLLLREAGIPARYAVGFSAHETKANTPFFIVRYSHAHAWALAYIAGQWQSVDTTPPDWSALEAENTAAWQAILDAWPHATFRFSLWYRNTGKATMQNQMPLLMLALTIWLIWRSKIKGGFIFSRNRQRTKIQQANRLAQHIPLARIEATLAKLGWPRNNGETLRDWCQRIDDPALTKIIWLYYHLRFDPNGISANTEQQLNRLINQWRPQFSAKTQAIVRRKPRQ